MPLLQPTERHVEEYQAFLDLEDEEEDDFENYVFSSKRENSSKRSGCSRSRLVLAVIALLVVASLVVGIIYASKASGLLPPHEEKVVGVYKTAAVAADSAQCSSVGKDILLQGGNAVDAAIAALLCSGLTAAQSMGVGGGFLMTVYNRTSGLSTVIDAREVASAGSSVNMFEGNRSKSKSGPLSIAVPGEVKGYWLAHQKFGQLPWNKLFEPAIKMAAEGFPVPLSLHKAIAAGRDRISAESSLRSVFFNPKTAEPYQEGEIMLRTQLAETLRIISEEGAQAFYNGSLTEKLLSDLKDIGSIITSSDLLEYKAKVKVPLRVALSGDLTVLSPPPPASGAVLSLTLSILDGYRLTAADLSSEELVSVTYHRIVEAFKFAYAKRTDLGDADFVNLTELVSNMTSRSYADELRKLIADNRTFGYEYYGPTFYDADTTGTSHLAVIDQYGNAVSVTSTINSRFGCKSRGTRTGIIFNNEMDDFSSPNIINTYGIRPSPANFIVPGKRPLSSMCPAIFLDSAGNVRHVLGASGGSKITTATAWVAAHVLWLGLDMKRAVETPRLHHQLLPPWVSYETGLQKPVLEFLKKLGHNVTEYAPWESVVQGISVHSGLIYAVSDVRKGGEPAGF